MAVHVQVTPVNAGPKVSVTVASVAVLGPALVTTSVQVSGAPALIVAALGVLVIARSATSCGVVETEALSFSGFGSTGALDWRLAVLVAGPSAVTRPVIDSVWVAVAGMAPTVHRPLTESYVPCDAVADSKATLAGSTSLTVALVAALGPRLVTAIV